MKILRTIISTTAVATAIVSVPAAAQDVTIVQPGAPGQATQTLTAEQAIDLADASYSPADVRFMQGMIVHHRQAVEMSALVKDRTNQEDVVKIAGKIDASQGDEITFMEDWLEHRGESATMAGHQMSGHQMADGQMPNHQTGARHMHMGHHQMAGMATPAQMTKLANSNGTAFDRLFLQLMIAHHKGAIVMVDDLHRERGSAFDPVMFNFTNDIVNDQTSEIDRMNGILAQLSDDPRATLAAGLTDAGQAISNLRLVTALPKPAGFFDPANPGDLQPEVPQDDDDKKGIKKKDKPEFSNRGPMLSFANTDMAFSGDILVAGNYHGFNSYRLGKDGVPELIGSTVCPGGQGDVSIVGDILIMSVQDGRGRVDCGLEGVVGEVNEERFRGLRIFDISDIAQPLQIGQVQTCRGSHTHSVVTSDADRIVVYNSGTSYVREEEELPGCIGNIPGDDRTALFSIDVVEIPLADPSQAKIIDSPHIFANDGQIAGLWRGGDHGDDTQDTSRTDQCHDITVFPAMNIAAGACSGNGIVLDISDPMKPVRIDDVTDKGFAYWHSATFNNDGTKVLFTDEWGGGGRPRCQAGDPMDWGANAIYEIVDGKLAFRSTYKLPAPQTDMENCVAHNGSIIPVPGRDIFVQAWYQGGISVIDFTDAKNPFEIAYFDRGPISDEQLVAAGYWSAYWYNGRIYATEITRGLDVFALEPSEFLTTAEIAAAEAAQYAGGVFNPQTQTQVSWPEDVLSQVAASRAGG